MPTFRVHVAFTLPAPDEQDAEDEIGNLLEEVDAAGDYFDWEITYVVDYDDWEADEEFVEDEW